ncbi:MAG TPA: ABC transporter permease [Methanothrix sp.]|nr:ABC transporter permease [Methanothrix sp.]HPT19004.1 ABC transporter permease [Methanothrix sp.]
MEEIWNGLVRAVELIVTLNPEVMGITIRSLSISFVSVLIAAAINIPLGGLIEFRNFRGKGAVVNLIQTLYGLPTVTVGLFVFLLLSRSGPLGGLQFLYTPTGMVIGQMILISPILIGLTISALKGISPSIRDTAVSLGASQWQVILTVIKEARHAVIAAILIAFGRAISEVGVAMMIGGNIRGYTRVLTTSIALQTSMGNLEMSMALGIILICISMLLNLALSRFQGR